MDSRHGWRAEIRLTVIVVFAMASLGTAQIARAQDAAAASESDPTQLRAVEVTGSRIKKTETEGESPVITLTAKDLAETGVASIGDILQRLSVSGSSLNTKFNSAGNFGFPANGGGVGSGSATFSLRNLGANRVLVLVDGLRWVNESSASGVSAAVDLNTIPVSIIDHIDILTDGASSLYGSDAIAGVVNIVTKKSQDGGALHAYYGDYSVGDGQTYTGDISFGAKSKRYSFFLDLSHFDQQGISSGAWGQSSFPVPGGGLAFGSSATPTGRFVFTPPPGTSPASLCPPDATGANQCDITPNGPANPQNFPGNFHQFSDADRYNFAPSNLLLTPSRRTALFAQSDYRVTDDIHWYVKGLYQARNSVNQAAPEPIFLGPGAGTGGLADTVGVDASNPYNPFGYTLDPNTNLALIGRRPVEGGPRVFSQDVDTQYYATGFKGEFDVFQRLFSWDVNYVSSTNDASQTVNGTYNILHIANALGPVNAAGQCTLALNTGCVPLDIFGGPGTITPQQLAYIQFTENDRSRQSLDLITANLSGTVVALPGGDLDFAAGYEHRKLEGSYSPDSVVVAGESNGVPSLPTSGSYFVNEYYLEFNAPVLEDVPLIKKFDLDLASRFSDYSTFGSTIKSKLGARWQVVEDVVLRGTYAEGFRAPSVGELFGSPARFDANINDPCSGAGATSNCQALGVPAGFVQANPQISVRTGGDLQLQPETSRSITGGAVYSPSWAEHKLWSDKLDFELTYYRELVDNAIQAPDAQTLLNRCVASGDPDSSFCSGIQRARTGDINFFGDTLQNLGRIDTSGVDLAINWTGPKYVLGRFGASWNATYVDKYHAIDTDSGLPEPNAVGVEVDDSGIPRWKSTLRFNWALNNLSATYALRYISSLRENCGDAAGLSICGDNAADTNRLHSVTYSDLQASYKLPVPLHPTLTAGVNNVFDASPPPCLSCSLNGYDASNYDLTGRFFYVEAGVKF